MIYIRRRVIGRGRRTSYMLRNVHIRYRSSAIAASNSRIVTLAISHKCNPINTKKLTKVKLTVNYCRAVFLYRLMSLEILENLIIENMSNLNIFPFVEIQKPLSLLDYIYLSYKLYYSM